MRSVAPLAAALLALAACEQRAQVAACPGDPVARLHFDVALGDGGTCPSVPDGGQTFTGALSLDGDGGAWLCLDREEAAPLAGTYDGGHVSLGAPAAPASLDACACDLTVVERLEGDLVGDGGTAAFTGKLYDDLAPATPGAVCEKDGGTAACGVPCTAAYDVTAAP